MDEGERSEFLEWYEKQEPPLDNRRALEQYCQDDVTVLRQACEVFRQIHANMESGRFSRIDNYRIGMQ